MTRRTALWLLGSAMVVLAIVLMLLDGEMHDAGGPGIIPFEFAGNEQQAQEILADWGDDGQDAARLSLWLDYPYLIAYGAFWALAAAAIRDTSRRNGWSRMARAGSFAPFLPIAGAGFDAVEDIGLLLALGDHGGDVAPLVAAVCASFKFLFTGLGILYVLAGLVLRARLRLAGDTA